MRPDQEKPIEFSAITPDNHPAADHNLPLEPTTISLLQEIRASKRQNGKITNGARSMGSDFTSG